MRKPIPDLALREVGLSILDFSGTVPPALKLVLWASSRTPDWGSVPDWLAGGGAMLALIFAGWAALSAHSTNKLQGAQLARLENREAERREEELRKQASQVAVWLETKPDTRPIKVGQFHLAVCYSNTSGLPVYDALIVPTTFGFNSGRSYKIAVIPPTVDVQVDLNATDLLTKDIEDWAKEDKINKGADSATVQVSSSEYELARHFIRRYGVTVQFDDCQGVGWERDSQGILRLIETDHRNKTSWL